MEASFYIIAHERAEGLPSLVKAYEGRIFFTEEEADSFLLGMKDAPEGLVVFECIGQLVKEA